MAGGRPAGYLQTQPTSWTPVYKETINSSKRPEQDLNLASTDYKLQVWQPDWLLGHTTCLNPFSPNNDQHQISPCNINAYSTPEVMGIKDMITQG